MFQPKAAFSGFSVGDLEAAKKFYSEQLGLKIEESMGGLTIHLPGTATVWCYVKSDHTPAAFTILNFVVEDINAAVDALSGKGVVFEKYDGFHQDEKGIAHGKDEGKGPNIAWFKDPFGNILSVLES